MQCARCPQENPAHARFCLGCEARLALVWHEVGLDDPAGAVVSKAQGAAAGLGDPGHRPKEARDNQAQRIFPSSVSAPSSDVSIGAGRGRVATFTATLRTVKTPVPARPKIFR